MTAISLDIETLLAAYAGGQATPEHVVRAIYARIRQTGPRPVWITLVPEEEAVARAVAAQGPLGGVPFAVKDNIDVAGLPTTCACPEFAYVPERSASVVERLLAAGAVLIGKTNLDQFATGLNGTRSPYGVPACSFDSRFVSGGSSSGSAVAVASGLASFALGTDTAGSGRVPAAFNNIVGLKPTKGLLSGRGVVPACRTQDTVSVFALTTGDATRVTAIAAGFDAEDPYSRRPPAPLVIEAAPRQPRIGIPAGQIEFFGDEAAAAGFRAAVEAWEKLGARIVRIDDGAFREAASLLYAGPWVAERLAAIRDFATAHPSALREPVRSIILGAANLKTVDAFQSMYRLQELIRRCEPLWQQMDALMVPTAPTIYTIAAMEADPITLNSNLGAYTNFVNLMDLSALAVPAGLRADGLPFGVTLIGRAFEDGRLAALGDAFHRSLGGARLGATTTPLAATPPLKPEPARRVRLAVVGAHLEGQPLNGQLKERNARLVGIRRTAPGYSFYALAGTTPPKPGLIYDGRGAGGIEVEIYELDDAGFGSFVALIPAPLGIGTIKLDDGSTVQGFLCEAHAVDGALDITASGGWRAWLATRGR